MSSSREHKSEERAEIDEAELPNLHPRVHEAIGLSLQAHYRALVEAPVPDRFLVLLAELEARETCNGR